MIICEDNLWESDYILNELLPKQEVKFIPFDYIERVNFTCDIFIFASRKHNFWNIKETVRRIEPKIIIMLSDEFYQENLFEYNMLGNYCDLFLRNYHHQYYNYTSNTLVFPLGYTNGCEKFTSNKKYNWSFIGKITKDWCSSDREEMVNIFSQLPNHYINTNLSQEEMCKIYSQSHFVPCGRGNSSLDCFRLYEASMNGAIPVVVGSQKEIECTFKYEENPPWVFADTWEEAFEKCKCMLECGVDNKSVLEWWNNRIQKIKNKVLEVL
jgi:hypothetical protein